MYKDYFTGKTALITGGTGLIGSHIAKALLSVKGAKVIVVGRSLSKMRDTFSEFSESENLLCIEHDIANPLPHTIGHVDFIFHAASPISGEIIKTRPLDVINSNLSGTINCLEYINRQGTGKMIVFSSATIYSNDIPTHVAVESETNIAECIDAANAPYSESKRMIEVIANAYHKQFDTNVLIVRLSYVYGYSKHPANTAFYEFIKRAIDGEDILMNKSGLPRRDNIYVDDAVNGILHLCRYGAIGETYNISSSGDKGNYCAVDEMAEIISDVTHKLIPGNSVKVTFKEKGLERMEGLRLSNQKIKSTGWELSTSIYDGILMTIKNYLNK